MCTSLQHSDGPFAFKCSLGTSSEPSRTTRPRWRLSQTTRTATTTVESRRIDREWRHECCAERALTLTSALLVAIHAWRPTRSKFAAAISDFSRAIELLPHNADFYHNRGFCYRKQGNFAAAISDYTRALLQDPNHFKSTYNRAFCNDKVRGWPTLGLSSALRDVTSCVLWHSRLVITRRRWQTTREPLRLNQPTPTRTTIVARVSRRCAWATWERCGVGVRLGSNTNTLVARPPPITVRWAGLWKRSTISRKPLSLTPPTHRLTTLVDWPGTSLGHARRPWPTLRLQLGWTTTAPCFGTTGDTACATCTCTRGVCGRCGATAANVAAYYTTILTVCFFVTRGDYERAIENSTRAIELEPRHAPAFNNRGYAYRKLGLYEKAVEGT